MPTYATITTSVTGHGSDAAMRVVLRATPVVPDSLLEYPAEPARISVGRVQAGADDDGLIRLPIPLNTDPAAPWWEFELRFNPRWGRTRVIPLGTFQVTGSTTLAALMFPGIPDPEPTDPSSLIPSTIPFTIGTPETPTEPSALIPSAIPFTIGA